MPQPITPACCRPRRLLRLGHLAALMMLAANLFAALPHAGALAAELSGRALVEALRQGGFTIYFRHAETDWSQSDSINRADDVKSCDPARVRQLSDAGRATATRIGQAMRTLNIPVAKVLSSPYCRAVETVRLMAVGEVAPTTEIMNLRAAALFGGREAIIARTQRILATPTPASTNVIIGAHGNLMQAATDAYPSEGGAGVFRASASNPRGFELVALLTAQDWTTLAEKYAAGD